ncbi:hypothetical protein A0H81_14363 [Grifola frondosa]|uniref:Aminoglycoside phosphotransferase domain-containing protein n=1 Tax=Grifola frondosa TaxID=5627 RepID=A0A1C7LLR1_GRIFR|nr:hypothetical protein A0H81_14363 [Grifola frondosa]
MPSTTFASPRDPEPSQERIARVLERVRLNLNKSIARKIAKAFDEDPAAEFERVVQDALESYHRRLSTARETAERRQAVLEDVSNVMPPAPKKLRIYGHQTPTSKPVVTLELAPSVLAMLGKHNGTPTSDIPFLLQRRLPQLIDDGKCLFSGLSRMIVQLSDDIVVKLGPNIAQDEPSLLDYVSCHTSIPVPRALGLVTIGPTSYMFSTLVPGETLEKRWPDLMKDQKTSVCYQLNDMMSQLRRLPHLPSIPLGCLSSPHVCKHACMRVSVSAPDLQTIPQFHDFLTSRPARGISSGYLRWLRSLLRDDYRITLTHGDLHPRNIMVVEKPDGGVRVSGIIGLGDGWLVPGVLGDVQSTQHARRL